MIYEYINFNLESTLVCPYIRFYLPVLIRATLPPLWYSIYVFHYCLYSVLLYVRTGHNAKSEELYRTGCLHTSARKMVPVVAARNVDPSSLLLG